MVSYMSLEEQVDKDFSLARRRTLPGRIDARLRRDAASDGLLCFGDLSEIIEAAVGGIHRGVRMVPVEQIRGSVGRCSEFDGSFMPARASVREMDAHGPSPHRGEGLPPVSLYKVGGLLLCPGWPPQGQRGPLPRRRVDRRRSDQVLHRVVERPKGQRQPDRATQSGRTEIA